MSAVPVLLKFKNCFQHIKKTHEFWVLCKGRTKDITGHINVTVVGEHNACLNACAANCAKITVVELNNRHYLDVFNQERISLSNIVVHIKLMLSPNKIVCKSENPDNNLIIQNVNLIIHTTMLTRTTHGALMVLLIKQTMRYHLFRV